MTDRIAYLTVTLEKDMREDDVHSLLHAVVQLRGVRSARLGVADPMAYTMGRKK